MVRRRSTKASRGKSKPRPLDRSEGKLKRWNKPSDIPLDEEEQFHASRDKILLEGDQFVDDDDGEEDEVFGLKGIPDSDEDGDEDGDEDMAMDGYEEGEDEEDYEMTSAMKKSKAKSKKGKKGAAQSSSSEQSESEEETWGRGKAAYYSSNAAQLDSDDEEANELEEQEAKRLQAKARSTLLEDDFGLADPLDDITALGSIDELLDAAPAPVSLPLPEDKKSLVRHLEKTSPEALALARDWEDTAITLVNAKRKLEEVGVNEEASDDPALGLIHIHYQTLLTYATTLAFYLHLRANEKYAQRPDLLGSHPILPRLLTLKQALMTLEDLNFAVSDDDDEEDDELYDADQLWKFDRKKGLELGELEDLLKDAHHMIESQSESDGSREIENENESESENESDAEPVPEPPKKKRKTTSETNPIFDLVEPTFSSSRRSQSSTSAAADAGDAYGEATSLQHADAADKAARRKSLRFHIAKIESASARRQGARTAAAGGDDDIPYKERRREREARAAKEAQARVKGQGGDDLDDVEPQPVARGKRTWDEGEDEGNASDGDEGEDGYYELIKKKQKESKAKKKADYDAAQAAARPVFQDEATSGPRSLTRAILANKGLTPHRSKSVRNPRVKKRQKYEKAKRKVASQRPVFKGGLGESGRYEGEKTGISKVVKSIRLG